MSLFVALSTGNAVSGPVTLHLCGKNERDCVLALARAFHAEDGHPLPAGGERAIDALLHSDRDGLIWLIRAGTQTIGYAALCFGFAIEYGGRDAFLDDIYIVPQWRGRGAATQAIGLVLAAARSHGCGAVHLEVMPDNEQAARLYRRLGFAGRHSSLMSLRLDGAPA